MRETASSAKASQVHKALMMAASDATAESPATGYAIYAKINSRKLSWVRCTANNDEPLLMIQACIMPSALQLQVLTRRRAELGTSEPAPLSWLLAQLVTRPVADLEDMAAPT
jgi:hypothetical protein